MQVAVAVGRIQEKSRFTAAEGESRNSTVIVGEMLAFNKNSGKSSWDFGWFKNPQGVVPLPNQPNLFLILQVISVFVIRKSNQPYLHIFIIFIDHLTYI